MVARPHRRQLLPPCCPHGCSHSVHPGMQPAAAVSKHTARGHFRSGTRPLHDQRIVTITTRGETDHVVGQGDVGKRMFGIQLYDANSRLAVRCQASDVAEHLALGARRLQPSFSWSRAAAGVS